MSERDDGRSNGDDPLGNDAPGDDPLGNDAPGDDPLGNDAPGDDPLGNDAPGDEPLGDLARRVRERRDGGTDADDDGGSGRPEDGGVDPESGGVAPERGDRADAFDDGAGVVDTHSGGEETDSDADALFEEVNVAEVDPDRVWESVLDADDDSLGDASDPGAAVDADPGPAVDRDLDDATEDADDGDDGHLVRKRAYCESCEYFTAPPEVACTYDGGEIVEVVDSDRFRVRNCPVVAGRIDTDGVALSDGSVSDVSVDDIE